MNTLQRLLRGNLARAGFFFVLLAGGLSAASPLGRWKTIDDETGRTKSIVEITEVEGALQGRVVQILYSDLGPNPKCDKCPGERRGQPIEGMVILWNMTADGDDWSGGKILDPKKGKIYSCRLSLEGDNQLQVRGFLGISLIGRTQTWQRE